MTMRELSNRSVQPGGIAALFAALALSTVSAYGASIAIPALPKTFDTTYAAPAGNTITVAADGDLQDALNRAQLGDTLVLQAGATYTGPFKLPNKSRGSGWVYVRTSAYGRLPAPGTRVGLADAVSMPKIVGTSRGGGAIVTAASAHHFRFVGIEFAPAPGQFL